MLAVVNMQHQISGIITPSTELHVNHEFNLPATRTSEVLIESIIQYIKQHENPVTLSTGGVSDEQYNLHNILTQAVMSSEICKGLLNFISNSTTQYKTFWKERLVMKQRSIFDTIHRMNMKTFKSLKSEKNPNQARDK